MELIKGATSPSVWLNAVEYLSAEPKSEDLDVILHIAEPTVLSKADRAVHDELDEFLTSHGAFSLHTVAETIFPMDEYIHRGVDSVFGSFPEKLRAIQRSRKDGNWGSYSYRFLRQKDNEGKTFNPLEDLLAKIIRHGKYKASFELNTGYPLDCDISIYDARTDRKRLYGGPCLSHLSIKVHNKKIHLNATYRSHYYVRRLLGNLVGLGRLQYFIAREAELEVGGLTINSTFAKVDSGSGGGSGGHWTKSEVGLLVERCREIYRTRTVSI